MIFRSPEDEQRYKDAYYHTLSTWPISYKERKVQTSFGLTHIIEAGSEDAPPLVLMHGMGVSSTMWGGNIQPLSEKFHVFAIDTMGDMSLSQPEKYPKNREDYANWLEEVLDGLELKKTRMLGMSYGGWQILNYAISSCERIEKIALCAPAAAFAPISLPFILLGLPLLIYPTRRYTHFYMKWPAILPDDDPKYYELYDPLIDQMYTGWKYGKVKHRVIPTVYTDEELQSIDVPVLLMVGEHEKLYSAERVFKRAEKCLPQPTTLCIPDASHDLTIRQRDLINQEVLAFMES